VQCEIPCRATITASRRSAAAWAHRPACMHAEAATATATEADLHENNSIPGRWGARIGHSLLQWPPLSSALWVVTVGVVIEAGLTVNRNVRRIDVDGIEGAFVYTCCVVDIHVRLEDVAWIVPYRGEMHHRRRCSHGSTPE